MMYTDLPTNADVSPPAADDSRRLLQQTQGELHFDKLPKSMR